MFKKIATALTLCSLTLTAAASSNWQVGGGFGKFSDSSDGSDLSLNMIYGAVSYKIQKDNSNFFFVPELRLGTGISDDSIKVLGNKVTTEIKRFVALSVRGQLDYKNGAYIYVMPSYANLDMKARSDDESFSDDEWEFGIGGGVGYRLNKNTSVEAAYETYDGTKLLSVAFKYTY